MKYCSNCKAELVLTIPEGENLLRYFCPECKTIHYQNPKLIVGTLCIWEEKNQILLCKRALEPRKDKWTLPSGFMENGESSEEGAKRETVEEANANIKIDYLHTLYNIPHINQVHIFYKATLLDKFFSAGIESTDVSLFDLNDIPWSDLAFQSVRFCLTKYLENPNFKNIYPTYIETHRNT